MRKTVGPMLGLCGAIALASPLRAEPSEIAAGHEFGLGYLPYLVMEHEKLVEKEAEKAGVPGLKVTWNTFGGSGATQDAILSGRVQFVSSGLPWLITLWSKSNAAVKSIGGVSSMPVLLNTRNAQLHSIKDLSDKDRIALPAIKTSTQAMVLQMAAAQAFGADQVHKLDVLTVAMNHPDGMVALLAGNNEIDCHLTAPPYQGLELKDPRIHTILNSYDVLGGPANFIVASTTVKFHDENPKTTAAFAAALREAEILIGYDKLKAVDIYLEMTHDKSLSGTELLALLNDPQTQFTMQPQNTMKFANFMRDMEIIKAAPQKWQDLFFDNAHSLPGS